MQLAFIGGGNMGEAILAALLEKKRAIPAAVTVSDVSPERRSYLGRQYGVTVTDDNTEAVRNKDVVILAVKPQQLPDVMSGLKGWLTDTQLVLSIAAGVRTAKIAGGLKHARVVRAMPNTPARIGEGITGWTCTESVTPQQKEQARIILGSMGKELFFEDEGALDMVTAVSGSGPAYVFAFTEALTAAGEKLGMAREQAAELALSTVIGAARLMETSGQSPADLRRAVTSKGGTTEKALLAFETGGLDALVAYAVRAAYDRARELGV